MPATNSIDTSNQSGPWPNLFIFPEELREMIPNCGPRALVVGEVTGEPNHGLASGFGPSATRAVVRFVVHESGKIGSRVPVYLDMDGPTLRSLGQFLTELAQQIDGTAE